MSLKLFFPIGNPRGAKILVAAQLAQVPVEHVSLTYEDIKKPEHLARHPLGKVPALETPDGPLFESNAILRYIARQNKTAGLLGSNPYQEGQVDQWIDFVTTEIEPLLVSLIVPVFGFLPLDPQAAQKTSGELIQKLKAVDAHLNGKQFMVGGNITLADVQLYFNLNGLFRFVYGEKVRAGFPNLMAWFNHVSTQPAFLEHFGRARMCNEPFPALQVQKQQQQPKCDKPKQEKPKTEKPVEEKKKQEKKKKEEEEDDGADKQEKQKDPLDLLPPSPFNIDDWKRKFLASKDWAAEFKWFWENLDEQGWSCWIIYYEKAEGEGAMLLKTNNTMKGFLQRIDPHFKKHCFAIHGVYGDEPNLEIRGAWLWRGAEIPLVMKEHPSFEFHKFVKVTKDQVDQRGVFEQYWLNQTEDESVVEGLKARTLVYFR